MLPNDIDNFMEYHVIELKPDCVPTKFKCQLNTKRTSDTTEQSYILKKQRKILVEEFLKDHEENITSKHLQLEEASSESAVSHEDKESITQQEQKTADKAIQVYMTHKFRSKAIQTEIKFVSQMTSPLRPNLRTVSTSPFHISQCNTDIKPSTSNLQIPTSKLFAIDNQSDSDLSYTPTIPHRGSSPSPISLQIKSTSDCTSQHIGSTLPDGKQKQRSPPCHDNGQVTQGTLSNIP